MDIYQPFSSGDFQALNSQGGNMSIRYFGAGVAGFSETASIVIDHTKCGSATDTNFTVYVALSDATLKTTGNGGVVQNVNGDDIVFSSDSTASSLYNWELEYYDGTNGVIYAHVKIPSVSHLVDTTFYINYGKSGITTFQGGATGTAWDSNFKQVLHAPNGTTLSLLDSTSNAYNGTNNGVVAGSGKMDGGVVCDTSGDYVGNANGLYTMIGGSDTHTESCWIQVDNPAFGSGTNYFWDGDVANGLGNFANIMSATSVQWGYGGAGTFRTYTLGTTLVVGTFFLIHMVKTASGDNAKLYINGTEETNFTGTVGNLANSVTTSQWGRYHASGTLALLGKLDEMRISAVARTASWILKEYNNQNNPGNFSSPGFYTVTTL